MPGERRKFKRIELLNEVSYEANRSEILAQWTDISIGGIFVQTMAPPDRWGTVEVAYSSGSKPQTLSSCWGGSSLP